MALRVPAGASSSGAWGMGDPVYKTRGAGRISPCAGGDIDQVQVRGVGWDLGCQVRCELLPLKNKTPDSFEPGVCFFASSFQLLASSFQLLLHLAGQFRHQLKQVTYQAIIRYLEDRGFLVLVDGNNDLGILHTRQVLDRTGDTDSDIQLGRHDLAGLADLHVVGHKACVHCSARGTYGSAQLVGQAVQQLEVVAVLHAATAGDHDLGTSQLGTVGLGQFFAHKGGGAGVLGGGNRFHCGTATFGGHGVEAGAAHGDDLDRGVGLDGGDGVTGIDRALEGVGAFDGDDLGDLVDVQQSGNARQVVL